ncbi:MAG TPA: DsbA family protein [Beutenbergiaceae bacterium]|nr:DsbA family protein [Beutenbergiaceae bacterium]
MLRRLVVIGAVLVIGVLAYVLWPSSADDEGTVAEVIEPDVPERVDVERHQEDDPLAVGEVEAPVTIVVFSDFQCPYCALWNDETLPALHDYVDQGDLRIEWRDIAVFGEDSQRAAQASYAAGMQGKYTEFASELFDGGQIRDSKHLGEDALVELASELGLQEDQFTDDFHSDDVAEAVDENMQEALDLGVFTTPVFLVNGLPIAGAQPTQEFIETVESELPDG